MQQCPSQPGPTLSEVTGSIAHVLTADLELVERAASFGRISIIPHWLTAMVNACRARRPGRSRVSVRSPRTDSALAMACPICATSVLRRASE